MIFFFSFGPHGPNFGLSSLLFLVPFLFQTGIFGIFLSTLRTIFSIQFWWRTIQYLLYHSLDEQYSVFSLPNVLGLATAIGLGIYVGLAFARNIEWSRAGERVAQYFLNHFEQLISPIRAHFPPNPWGRHRAPPKSERIARVQKILSKLPIEEYKTRDDLMKMSAHSLKEYVRGLGIQCGHKGLMEKGELVNMVIDKGGSTWATCSICFEDYESGDALRRLPCMHTYHIECIDKWLLSSTDYSRPPACPLCNADIAKEN